MKKNLLLSTILLVSVGGFSQNTVKKAVNPKVYRYGATMAAEAEPSINAVAASIKGQNSTMSGCSNAKRITTSYNCLGTGGGLNTSTQNCLSYNSDLNALVWTQRGSKTWTLCTTSGFIQSTIINATTLATDSIITYADANMGNHARYPGGAFLNPIGNTDYHKAFAVGSGQVISDANIWTGAAYCAKPLSSASAINHTTPAGDSLFSASAVQGSVFGDCSTGGGYTAAPATDMQALPDGKTIVVIGAIRDTKFGNAAGTTKTGLFAKGTSDSNGKTVTWTVDSSSLTPDSKVGSLGHLLNPPRMAFGPDGLHGYAIFTGILNTVYHNLADSALTPILYQTTNGGSTWTQVLAGYDWMTNHPEVAKNVGMTNFLGSRGGNYNFDDKHGVDLTVDANNVLHYVCTVAQPYNTNGVDSLTSYGFLYDYDYVNYHPIIWDFMTDGTCWKTMMVDSIISALCGTSSDDTTSTHSAMGGAEILGVGAHITVSRSSDGTKVFYGWADSDPGVTGSVYNTNPDILMKAYDISSGMVSATTNITNGTGTCFYPFLSDISYFDGTEWVVPAVYTVGHFIATSTGQTTYNASAQADYYYTNCGTFNASAFTTAAAVNNPANACGVGIKVNNAFESSISNYPNPFNNTTTIAVNLSENKAVDVKIYNTIGNLVFSKKVNGTAGSNTITFDGGQLSSGVYYYTVSAGNEQATKKMIIQK